MPWFSQARCLSNYSLQKPASGSTTPSNIVPTVTGSQDTALTWTVNGIAGGNAQIGTISAKGIYTAPAVVPNPNLVVVQATSVDNPNSTMIVNVQVLNPVPTLLSATPTSLNIGSSTVVLSGANFINGATALANGVPVPTQFNSSGQLTATVDPTVAGPFDLQVLNPNPGGAVSADVIEQVAGTPPTPLVEPADASRFLMQATLVVQRPTSTTCRPLVITPWFRRAIRHTEYAA